MRVQQFLRGVQRREQLRAARPGFDGGGVQAFGGVQVSVQRIQRTVAAEQPIQPARPGRKTPCARQPGARGIGRRHAIAHGKGRVQGFGFVRVVIDHLPQPGRLRGAQAQGVVQRLRIQPKRGGR